jgi:predicted nucleic acid-binding Zn ribbon protein
MDRLGNEIKKTARRVGLPAASEVVSVWPRVVGETIATNAWPARLTRGGVLQVNTSSATWAFELKHLAPQILSKLEQVLAEECPRELRFAPGPVPSAGRESSEPLAPAAPATTARERAQAEELAAVIDNEELRVLVARAAAASLAQNAKRSAL